MYSRLGDVSWPCESDVSWPCESDQFHEREEEEEDEDKVPLAKLQDLGQCMCDIGSPTV